MHKDGRISGPMRRGGRGPSIGAAPGGTVAALLFPVHLFLTGLAFPLGRLEAPRYEVVHRLVTHPLTRRYLFLLISLPLFHWAHRFLDTLYDGLELKHLTELIAVLYDGAVLLGSAMTA